MSTVTGTFKEIIKGKSGAGKKGPWQAWSFTLADGKRYSAGFEQPKAATGDQVSFEVEEGGEYDNQMVKGSFKVTKAATKEESAAAKTSFAGEGAGRNQSIENQVALKTAAEFAVNFFEGDFDAALKGVQKAYGVFVGCLAPTAASSAKPASDKAKPAPKKAEPPPAEDENQDPPY